MGCQSEVILERALKEKDIMRRLVSLVMALALMLGLAVFADAQRRGRGNLSPEELAARQAEQARQLAEAMKEPNPIAALDTIWLEELTWMEVRDEMKAGKTTALIPTGGVEPNGPYLATGKHNYVLTGACEGIARKLGNALCAPIVKLVPEGDHDPATGHMRSPGTISLRAETFEMLLADIATSLKAQGFEHIIFFGDSGGNQSGMEATATALNEKWGEKVAHFIPEFYRYGEVTQHMEETMGIMQESEGFHDDFVITSLMMVTDPTSVRYDQRVKAGKASINSVSIVPMEKTIEIGKKLMEYRVDQTIKAIHAAIGDSMSNQN